MQEGGSSLPQLLQRHEKHAGLALHWQLFSFDGHVERPTGGVLASYTACWPQHSGIHRHVKSIVQPRFVRRPESAHNFVFEGKHHAHNTAGVRVVGPILRSGQASVQGRAWQGQGGAGLGQGRAAWCLNAG